GGADVVPREGECGEPGQTGRRRQRPHAFAADPVAPEVERNHSRPLSLLSFSARFHGSAERAIGPEGTFSDFPQSFPRSPPDRPLNTRRAEAIRVETRAGNTAMPTLDAFCQVVRKLGPGWRGGITLIGLGLRLEIDASKFQAFRGAEGHPAGLSSPREP